MPATQTGSNGSLSADFVGQFDHAHDQTKSVFAVQKEPLDTLEHINEYWLSRVKSEAEFATTIANKLVTARSVSDVTSLYQDWLSQRMQRCVEDGNHVFADVQKLLRTRSRLAQSGNGGS